MLDKQDNQNRGKSSFSPGVKLSVGVRLAIIGFLIIWGSSIAFALQLKTLLTPGRYNLGADPSFDIIVAVFCFIIFLVGGLLLWRAIREIQGLPEGRFSLYINVATAINIGLLIFVFAIGALIFSANRAFAAVDVPIVRDQPAPDYSVPDFPTPAVPQPTPTFSPDAVYLSGSVISPINGFRVGTIWISASKAGDTVNYVQVYTNRLTCSVQQGGSFTTYAVDKSQQLISGPTQVQDGEFYSAQGMAVIHGIMVTTAQAYGTVYLHYIDPATNRSCDLGSFTWTAAPSSQ